MSIFRGFECTHVNVSDVNGTEQWCPVKGGGCITEVSLNSGVTVYFYNERKRRHTS